jgi:very-short-patch-repair endonuclease
MGEGPGEREEFRRDNKIARRDSSPALLEVIKEQRQNPTPAEEKLWQELRRKNISGYKFRRQHPVAGYILDFYCPSLKLGIEVDGEVHNSPDQKTYDEIRSEDLAQYGIRIIRFWNSEVMNDIECVCQKIFDWIQLSQHS